MNRLVMSLLALTMGSSVWALPTLPKELGITDGGGFVKISGEPLDILSSKAREATEYEIARQKAVIEAFQAVEASDSQEAYESNVTKFMDLATPKEMAMVFGQAFDETASNSEGVDIDNIVPASIGGTEITVNIATQRLTATYPGGVFGPIKISSAGVIHKKQYVTAGRGRCFTRIHPEVMHYSAKYHNSPMPHSLFYQPGYAIHGTNEENHLGRPASHGCVRISRANAATLFGIVMDYGVGRTRICII